MLNRRTFIQSACAIASLSYLPALRAAAKTGPLGKPIGIQLYTVRNETAKDLVGTLQQLAAMGFAEVEMAGYYGKSAMELRKLLTDLGLKPTSTHKGLKDLLAATQREVDYASELGVSSIVVPSPAMSDARLLQLAPEQRKEFSKQMTLDDWKWLADQLNHIARIAQKSGIRVGYHNHTHEFRKVGNSLAFDHLIASTDPALVTIELDIGWVAAAGVDPVAYYKQHAHRISMFHVKDLRRGDQGDHAESSDVGSGAVDWKGLFAAADRTRLTNYYYEQEETQTTMLESAKKSIDYLSSLRV